jgi:hypothetical protein
MTLREELLSHVELLYLATILIFSLFPHFLIHLLKPLLAIINLQFDGALKLLLLLVGPENARACYCIDSSWRGGFVV